MTPVGKQKRSGRPRPHPARTIGFMLGSFPLRIIEFVVVFVLLVLGVAMTMAWVGIPLLLGATSLLKVFTDRERTWIRTMLGVHIAPPERLYAGDGMLRMWQARLLDPVTWRDLGYVVIALPLGIAELALGILSICVPPVAIWLTPWIGSLHANLAVSMLGPNRTRRLEAHTEHLQSSRARGVDAAEAERRRIERDLHDGAQQRLVAVAIDLGRAKSKFHNSPEEVRGLIEEAHSNAKLAVSELRDLARGIYPAVLGDRGLDAALSAQAARSPVHVDVTVDVDPRPPPAVESTAYFIVCETLTNVAKHSGASNAAVRVWRADDTVVVEITDNGHGGAEIRPGGGLAGLADRAATIDGVITVVSPTDGPTVVRADLPCTW